MRCSFTIFSASAVRRFCAAILLATLAVWSGCSSSKPPAPTPPAVTLTSQIEQQAMKLSRAANWPAAATQWEKVCDQYRLLNDRVKLATALHNLGYAQQQSGNAAAAHTALEEASLLNETLGRRNDWWRDQIALLQVDAGKGEATNLQVRLDRLEPMATDLKDPTITGLYLNELGLWQTDQKEFSKATASFDRAFQQFRAAKYLQGEATVEGNMARLQDAQQKFDEAIALWRTALTKFERLAEPVSITHALAGLGRSYLLAGNDLPSAESYLRHAAHNYRTLGLAMERQATLALLAKALQAQGKTP